MILTKRSLVLPATPPSVRIARSWVSQVLSEIGRDDLVDAAVLGVSELVTNALLHSRPPLSVRVRGTKAHPRIEVLDSSPVPPQRMAVAPSVLDVDDFNVTTFGRGLDLVAMMSARWGSDLAHDGRSKSVWFEPTGADRADDADEESSQASGEIFAFDPSTMQGPHPADGRQMDLCLLRLPAQLFGELRRYHFEVRRELRLLSLADPVGNPLATELTRLNARADWERRHATGISGLDHAIEVGQEVVDLEYQVPISAPATMARIRDLLVEVYDAYSSEHLLALEPPEVLQALQTWYFTEFERQGAGAPPRPWSGPTTLPPA